MVRGTRIVIITYITLMKRIYILLAIEATLWSCQKADEHLSEDASKPNHLKSSYLEHKPNAEVNECKIVQVNYTVGSRNDVLQFTYNSSGDPISITRALGAHTGYPNFVFKYDDKDRMSELIGTYDNNNVAEYWHKYFYNNKNQIILDSAYIFPTIRNGFPENSYIQQATFYTYDNKDRIIKDSTSFPTPFLLLFIPIITIMVEIRQEACMTTRSISTAPIKYGCFLTEIIALTIHLKLTVITQWGYHQV